MSGLLGFPLRLFLFWLIIFNVFRLLLLFSQMYFFQLPFAESMQTFFAAFLLDVSTSCYVSALPMVFYCAFQFTDFKFLKAVAHITIYLEVFLITLISFANIILLKQWGSVINFRALSYLSDLKSAFASVSNLQILIMILILSSFTFIIFKIYNLLVKESFRKAAISATIKIIASFLLIMLTGVYARGGFQQIPINESAVYFSSNNKLNLIATNPSWHLLHSILQAKKTNNNPYSFYKKKLVENTLTKLLLPTDNAPRLFIQDRPNIVFILLESFSSSAVAELKGDTGIAPNLSALIKDGLLFSNVYSSGARTDVALPSVFSGFPAQPNHSIMRFTEKTSKLPSLLTEFKREKYHTSFYYGGDLNFSNMLSYLTTIGFDVIVGKDDFDSRQFNSKWGAQDEFVFRRHLTDIAKLQQPFFSTLLTLSSHEPYESPMKSPFETNTEIGKFKNVLYYTDYCLGDYLAGARKEPWYNNTVFIIMADHGNGLIRKQGFYETGLRHIPLLIYGEPLKENFRGEKITATAAQHDIAATLLYQLGMDYKQFVFSNNLLNPNRYNFAYQNMDDAVGWVTDSCRFVYNFDQNRFLEKHPDDCVADTTSAKAYLQGVYEKFLAY